MRSVKIMLIVSAILISFAILVDIANAACPENGVAITDVTTAQAPAQFVTSTICINWAAPLDLNVFHYHFYEDGVITDAPTLRSKSLTLPSVRQTVEIYVRAVSTDVEFLDTTVSDSLFVEWVDLQCLNGSRVVPCP